MFEIMRQRHLAFQFRSMVMFLADVARIMARPASELLFKGFRT